ncbi:major facilitator superfamily domain-containing protein 12-like [Diadema antillarum]|uniref:major facilitator superfamily domain-containing protein 12-like n=1 Tax=Diadema antillarum TaxID=105358 RepID=UPI003A8BB218
MAGDEPLVETARKPAKRLPLTQRLSYGVGHVLNDLCASMWFSYLLLYFHKVLAFSNSMAGGLLLLGQVSDGICTPLIGYESDRTKTGCCNYGRRKSWHLLGTICVLAAFTFIFQPVFGGENSEDWARLIYYAPFIVIFQFGWAATQISHLSLIPELTQMDGERVELNAIRYAFTVMSSIFVYLVTFLLLHMQEDEKDSDQVSTSLDSDDIPQFRYLVLIVVGVGSIFAAIFHLGTREPRRGRRRRLSSSSEMEDSTSYSIQGGASKLRMKWSDWLKEHQFYQIALLYMFTRLMVNIAQIYIPMYVTDTLMLDKESVALVPLVVYFSGFLSTFVAKPINKYCGKKLTYFLGAMLYIGACVWMAVPNIGLEVYGAAILLGAGGSTVLVTSLALTADLIGRNTESGAFVYGAMSFTDKLSNGVAVEIIQLLQPCLHCCPACAGYYKGIVTYVTGGAAIGSLIVLATLIPSTIGKRRKKCNDIPYVQADGTHSEYAKPELRTDHDCNTAPEQGEGINHTNVHPPANGIETYAEIHDGGRVSDRERPDELDRELLSCAQGQDAGTNKQELNVCADARPHADDTMSNDAPRV